ncbi:MAG: class I SAM-dependent methyltransferase [Pseudomonadota bacterium]
MRNYDLKEEIRTHWSEQAGTFDDLPAHKIEDRYGLPEWQSMLRQALRLEVADDLQGIEALDIACGTGEISKVLCSLGANVVGVDFAEPMLEVARKKLKEQAWKGLHADAESLLVLDDNLFDIAITRHLCWTLVDPISAYANWFRVLKPGGKLIVIDGNWSLSVSWWQRVCNWVAERIDIHERPELTYSRQHLKIVGRLPYSDGLSFQIICRELTQAGFVEISRFDLSSLYREGMRAWRLADRLRQTSENRFGLVATKRVEHEGGYTSNSKATLARNE